MSFLKNNTHLFQLILCSCSSIFFGIAAGINISLPFSCLIAVCTLAVVFSLLQKCKSQLQESVLVFFWAFGFVGGSTYWIVIAIYDPIRTPASTAWMVGGFVFFIHACIYALCYYSVRSTIGYLFAKFQESHSPVKTFLTPSSISLPLSLGIAEVVRTCGFWAMPWGMIGYTQVSNPVLTGLYPVVGVYGVAITTAALSVVLVYWIKLTQPYWIQSKNSAWNSYFKINFNKFIGFAAAMGVLFSTQFIQWTTASDTVIRARVLHTHMPNIAKYDLQIQKAAQEKMVAFSRLEDADLTFYPELYMVQPAYAIDKKLRKAIVDGVVETKNAQIFGSPSYKIDVDGRTTGSYNALIEIDTVGKTKQYAKEILLPFSEYMPDHPVLSWAMPYILKFPLSNFTSGIAANTDRFVVKNINIAASLCNESVYTFHVHSQVQDKHMLINAASDSWVPNRMYERHSWQILKARALEAQKPLLRSNNTGYSGFIDPWGKEYQMEYGNESDAVFNITPRYGNTPFTIMAALFAKL
jgi:apolipoprotein N-acyltransferase